MSTGAVEERCQKVFGGVQRLGSTKVCCYCCLKAVAAAAAVLDLVARVHLHDGQAGRPTRHSHAASVRLHHHVDPFLLLLLAACCAAVTRTRTLHPLLGKLPAGQCRVGASLLESDCVHVDE